MYTTEQHHGAMIAAKSVIAGLIRGKVPVLFQSAAQSSLTDALVMQISDAAIDSIVWPVTAPYAAEHRQDAMNAVKNVIAGFIRDEVPVSFQSAAQSFLTEVLVMEISDASINSLLADDQLPPVVKSAAERARAARVV